MLKSLYSNLKFIWLHPINKNQQISAIFIFLRWQIASRVFNKPIIHDWIEDAKVVIRPSETGLTQNLYCGLHEFQDMSFVLHAVTESDFFVDIGANSGSYTILACAVKGARGSAFEPVPQTFKRLDLNCKINDLMNRVSLHNLALGDEESQLEFSISQDCTNHVLTKEEIGVIKSLKVSIKRIDDMVFESNPTFFKIDVEGFETKVIQGGMKSLLSDKVKAVLLELNGSGEKYGFNEDEILKKMFDLGYKSYSYNPWLRKLESLNGKCLTSGNTLFIRDLNTVSEIVRNSPKVSVKGVSI
ncbi:FkbM family methyltransferase [Synechococcales cyanobacterium C]|uniref:FkbM family methyltransferase n=1 Tax=Petrachloros mirabilis ULC683 TaxID=2781853 RepID=A0A8K2A1Q2_9CYAN|nr:FkbM family methyltransferase [Petrachloros mirabilis]NCJ08081.1 FkbM family methyltransferase [Petrachloros mirabilis ULC683]